MEKLDNFDPSFITTNYFPHYIFKPEQINTGRCWMWAYLANKTFKDVELWDICCHAFVRYQNKFYDSERSFGESDWKDLPATNFGSCANICGSCIHIKRKNMSAIRLTEGEFKQHWKSQLKRFNTSFQELDDKVERVLNHAHI